MSKEELVELYRRSDAALMAVWRCPASKVEDQYIAVKCKVAKLEKRLEKMRARLAQAEKKWGLVQAKDAEYIALNNVKDQASAEYWAAVRKYGAEHPEVKIYSEQFRRQIVQWAEEPQPEQKS
ncbi:MAG: hypothetical protein LBK76_09890 [Verrucomicrobiales bacterium]|jgi:predicted  nucleic acid-binding Zn-ribbon protein|nr:hypothetical protein [Verrucomicrobiales bacterium]